MTMSLYEWGSARPWCITPEALSLMLALAAREEVDQDDLKQAMHGPKSLALRDGKRRDDSATMQTIDGVARIVIDGPIYRYADFFTKYSGGVTTEALARDVQNALDDPSVGAIAFVIDSPGGEATAINELSDTIYAARGKKPLISYIEGYGASAAYWIASAADTVVVDDSALVGSIGTVISVYDPTKTQRRTIEIVSTQSPKKRLDPTTEAGRAELQAMADAMTEVFIGKVMRNRGLSRAQVLAAEGGLLVGQQAVQAGLADRLGSEDQVMRELAAKAAQRLPFATPPARLPGGSPLRMEDSGMQIFSKEWWSNLFAAQAEAEGTPLAAAAAPRVMQISAEELARVAAPMGPLAAAETEGDPRDAELASLRERIAKQERAAVQARAEAFADGAIRSNKAMPAERESLIAAYAQAAMDDAGDGGTRVAVLESLLNQRAPHSLTQEQVAVGQGGVLESGAPRELAADRRRQLLSMTATGQGVLARRARSA
jgi:signal peptide peptidase SppA